MTSRGKRAVVALVTFLAGLYFVLEFVVPQTVPGMTTEGVVLSVTTGSITVRTQTGDRTFPLDRRLELFRLMITAQAKREQTSVTPRMVKDGETINLALGDERLEGVRVLALDRGAVTLLERGTSRRLPIGRSDVILRLSRTDLPQEVRSSDLDFGQTVRIGPGTIFRDQRGTAARFNAVVETMAIGMGLLSLATVNGARLRRRQGDWYVSLFFFVAVAFGVLAGLWKYYPPGTSERAASDLIVMRIITAVGSTIFSLLAFYLASAAYRAFRVRTIEAALMMASALVVMLGQTPFGTYLTSWLGEDLRWLWLPNVAAWMLREPITAVFRGLVFGIILGAIATAIRYWLSLERSQAMGGD